MMPMRMPGTSSARRVTVPLTLRRTWVRQGYMLPVVSKLKAISTGLLDMAESCQGGGGGRCGAGPGDDAPPKAVAALASPPGPETTMIRRGRGKDNYLPAAAVGRPGGPGREPFPAPVV